MLLSVVATEDDLTYNWINWLTAVHIFQPLFIETKLYQPINELWIIV